MGVVLGSCRIGLSMLDYFIVILILCIDMYCNKTLSWGL